MFNWINNIFKKQGPAIGVIIEIPPVPPSITFHGGGKEKGTLTYDTNGFFKFVGDADLSADIFIKSVNEQFYLKIPTQEELELRENDLVVKDAWEKYQVILKLRKHDE